MSQGPYVLGADFGTESVRVGIFDLTGRPVTFVAETYPLYHPHAQVGPNSSPTHGGRRSSSPRGARWRKAACPAPPSRHRR
jgi:ribulose kinase